MKFYIFKAVESAAHQKTSDVWGMLVVSASSPEEAVSKLRKKFVEEGDNFSIGIEYDVNKDFYLTNVQEGELLARFWVTKGETLHYNWNKAR